MATATNKKGSPSPDRKSAADPKSAPAVEASHDHWILRGFDAVYAFLASVKLAVICIASLALVLAGATFFESQYGSQAVRQYVYGHPSFAILLAFLGVNIFCAASIRFPWKKRQIGFVVTHIGLLVVLAGAFVSLKASDEGQLGMTEGLTSDELVRIDHSVIRVQKIEKTGPNPEDVKVVLGEILPFTPGAWPWETDRLAALSKDSTYQAKVLFVRSLFGVAAAATIAFLGLWIFRPQRIRNLLAGCLVSTGLVALTFILWINVDVLPSGPRRELLTEKGDPFTVVVKDFVPSSGERRTLVEKDPDGVPTARITLLAKPPMLDKMTDAFNGDGVFSIANSTISRESRGESPATVAFLLVKGPDGKAAIDDFLHLPADPVKDRLARFHYADRSGKPRVFEWLLKDEDISRSKTLPDSDTVIEFKGFRDEVLDDGHGHNAPDSIQGMLAEALGGDDLHGAIFSVKPAEGKPGIEVRAINGLPMAPNATEPLPDSLRIGYYHPPKLAAKNTGMMTGRFAFVEVMADENERLYARAVGRDGVLLPPAEIEVGKTIPLNSGKMKLALQVEEYLLKGKTRKVWVPVALPRERREEAIPAIDAEMTVDGITKKISLIRSVGLDKVEWTDVRFPNGLYRLAYDFDRRPFPFSMKLDRFEPGTDPGTGSFATYKSDIKLSDPELGLKDEPHLITMNEPLTHRGWSFYQSNFRRVTDPDTGRPDGAYASFFQVHYDPAWKIIYSGCLLVVLGTFLQFAMRAGVFTDGGKLEQAKKEAKLARAEGKGKTLPVAVPTAPEKYEDL